MVFGELEPCKMHRGLSTGRLPWPLVGVTINCRVPIITDGQIDKLKGKNRRAFTLAFGVIMSFFLVLTSRLLRRLFLLFGVGDCFGVLVLVGRMRTQLRREDAQLKKDRVEF